MVYVDGQPEQIEYRGYTIHLLGRVEGISSRVWQYEIYDESGEKASKGGNRCSEERDYAVEFAQNCVDEYIHERI